MEEKTCPVCDVELEVDEVYDGDIGLNTREEEWYFFVRGKRWRIR